MALLKAAQVHINIAACVSVVFCPIQHNAGSVF